MTEQDKKRNLAKHKSIATFHQAIVTKATNQSQ